MKYEPTIQVTNLRRDFYIAEAKPGLLGSMASLFSRKKKLKKAVDDISFTINEGEFVGYVGENGAGKSTTIKILTGILTPTSGSVVVNGVSPWANRQENAKKIGVVFGQRTQLWWDLPVRESFDLLRSIFRVPEERFKANYEELAEALELGPLLDTPVRKLSLGQRMRCDLAASMLHDPKILFLDEPTIGLDLIAKDHVRSFLKKLNQERKTTIILTTHDMDDIETLCDRIIILDEGKVVFDGETEQLKTCYAREKSVEVEFHEDPLIFTIPKTKVDKDSGIKRRLTFSLDETTLQSVIADLVNHHKVKDISIHEPRVEDVVKQIYSNPNLTKTPSLAAVNRSADKPDSL